MSDAIRITFNGDLVEIMKNTRLIDFLHIENISGRFLSVINDEVIPKSAHDSTVLKEGDKLDIMSPISGG